LVSDLTVHGPVPFRSTVSVALSIARGDAGVASVRVYDVGGRRVRTLTSGNMDAGTYRISWNGRTDHGNAVAPGVYFVRAEMGPTVAIRKVVRVQ
jgi:flagellar hook assembly protein FlgD